MKNIFLAFLVLISILAMAYEETPSLAQVDPNEAILQSLKNGEASGNKNVFQRVSRNNEKEVAEEQPELETPKKEIAIKPEPKPAPKPEVIKKDITKDSYKDDPNEAVLRKFGIEPEAVRLNKIQTAAGPRRATTWFSTIEKGQRMTLSFSEKPSYTKTVENGRLKLKFNSPVSYKPPQVPQKFQKSFIDITKKSSDKSNLSLEIITSTRHRITISENKRKIYIDAIDSKKIAAKAEQERKVKEALAKQEQERIEAKRKAEEEIAAAMKAAEEKAAAEAAKNTLSADENGVPVIDIKKLLAETNTEGLNKVEENALAEDIPVTLGIKFVVEDSGIERLVFDFEEPVPAAVIKRFGYYWLVFDTSENYRMPDEFRDSKIFNNYHKVGTDNLIYKLSLTKNAYAGVERIGSRWEVEFDPKLKYEVDEPLQVFENNEYISIKSADAGNVITLKDDFYREELNIVPVLEAGNAVAKRINKNDIIFDPTVQGILFRKVHDIKGIEVSEGGLKINKFKKEVKAIAKSKKEPIFEFRNWPQLTAESLSAVRKSLLGKSRFEYGSLFFTQKMYGEAAINLKGLKGYKSDFLYAAAEFMDDRFDKSVEGFNRVNVPSEIDENELLMWQIAANFKLWQASPDKSQEVEFTDDFQITDNIKNYPDNMSAKILLALIEKRVNDDELEEAQNYINEMPKRARVDQYNYKNYLQARIYNLQGKKSRAREVWSALAGKIFDRKVRSRAAASVIQQDFETGKITLEEMVKELDKARIIWRGDEFEYQTLLRIAEGNAELGRSREALRHYKEAITHFPNHKNNNDVIEQMQGIYRAAILSSFSKKDRMFDVVSTYYEFEELKPSGDVGDQITLELAEKLVEFDLLGEAINVLNKYSKKIGDYEERALVMTRVAILQYMNNQPEEALKTLSRSEMKNMPDYLKKERDLLLAEVLIKAGKDDLAMVALRAIPTSKANSLKAQVLWKEQKWQEMVDVYSDINEKSDIDILKIAVANTILGNDEGLDEMKKMYSERMNQGKFADSFMYVTNTQNVDYKNLTGTLKIDLAKDVVDTYRNKLKLGVYEEASLQ